MNNAIVGVGGQVLTAARVLANAAYLSGLNSRMSEMHGLTQQGGPMVSMARFGEDMFSPIFEKGEGGLLGLDHLEILRNIHLLSKDGAVIICDVLMPFAPTIAKGEKWPSEEQCLKTLKENVSIVLVIRRQDIISSKIASPIMANMVVIGALVGVLDEKILVEKSIESIKLLLPNSRGISMSLKPDWNSRG